MAHTYVRNIRLISWCLTTMITGVCGVSVAHAHSPLHSSSPPGLASVTFDTTQSEFTDGALNQGWWTDHPEYHSYDVNDSLFVGVSCNEDGCNPEFRNFFSFDLRHLAGHVISAKIRVSLYECVGDQSELYRLSDVVTDARTLNNNGAASWEIWTDLGSGRVYGEYEIQTSDGYTSVTLPLNKYAVRDINNSRGNFFSIGGRLVNISGENYLFGRSGGPESAVQLIVQVTKGPWKALNDSPASG